MAKPPIVRKNKAGCRLWATVSCVALLHMGKLCTVPRRPPTIQSFVAQRKPAPQTTGFCVWKFAATLTPVPLRVQGCRAGHGQNTRPFRLQSEGLKTAIKDPAKHGARLRPLSMNLLRNSCAPKTLNHIHIKQNPSSMVKRRTLRLAILQQGVQV